ncbi:hypothetical protein [Aestuariibacter sp. A3R04]|uniref:hypothetical protein n=1 Tax=Aestuariibacter sp. A3R04 TaxID=2841571 RepID=UPI001C0A1EF4|nr:hypothetical protein [Aestuariibacter sp. A3R04]MBU3022885.1 hypothetical protein [Aestuariibacter sp. A3R04]
MNKSFKKLLRKSGFVIVFGGSVIIDKNAACDFLHCSTRTLDRWINTDKPCPRAVSLLRMKARSIPDSWGDKYAFDINDNLITPDYPHGITPEHLRMIKFINANATRQESDNEYYKKQIAALRDDNARKAAKARIAQAANLLNEVINDVIFLAPNERPTHKKKVN